MHQMKASPQHRQPVLIIISEYLSSSFGLFYSIYEASVEQTCNTVVLVPFPYETEALRGHHQYAQASTASCVPDFKYLLNIHCLVSDSLSKLSGFFRSTRPTLPRILNIKTTPALEVPPTFFINILIAENNQNRNQLNLSIPNSKRCLPEKYTQAHRLLSH